MAINRIRADIDLDAILYNMESMHNKLKPGTMMAAVVKAAQITVGLCLFPTSFCIIRTGLIPPCSEPTTGLKSA